MNKLRAALRERTQPAHERLDALFSALDIKQPDQYARFLAAQAGAFEAIESKLDEADAQSVIPDWPERKRADAIRIDLDALAQASPAPAGSGQAPRSAERDVDWIHDRASILGAAYVLEGSRLGGRYLLKQVQSSPDPQVAAATQFLAHGIDQRLWPSFDALLGSSELSETELDQVVNSAVRTFEFFEASAQQRL